MIFLVGVVVGGDVVKVAGWKHREIGGGMIAINCWIRYP